MEYDSGSQTTFFSKIPARTRLALRGLSLYKTTQSIALGEVLSEMSLTSLDLRDSTFHDTAFLAQNSSAHLLTHLGLTIQGRALPEDAHPGTLHVLDVLDSCPLLDSLSLNFIKNGYNSSKNKDTAEATVSRDQLQRVVDELTPRTSSKLTRLDLELMQDHEVVAAALTPEHFPRLSTVRPGDLLGSLPSQVEPTRLDTYRAIIEAIQAFPPTHPLSTIEWEFSPELSVRARAQLKGMLDKFDRGIADIETLRRAYDLYLASSKPSITTPPVLRDHTIHLKHLDADKVRRLAQDKSSHTSSRCASRDRSP